MSAPPGYEVVCDGDKCELVKKDEAPVTENGSNGSSSMPVVDLLGDTLTGHQGKVATNSIAGPGKVVGLYFSAHWCPPCRAFTPKLAQFYRSFKESHAESGNLEIVFLSSDRSEKDCNDYYADMPWLLLPYDKRDLKASLSKKYKVQGIPTLVLLDAHTGEVITRDGREAVVSDPSGADFPWKPVPLTDLLQGTVINGSGESTDLAALKADKVLGLYFSAHWCPPCRGFTPQLADFYKAQKDEKGFEIVFVSSDRDEASFKGYLSEMPWWSLQWKAQQTTGQELSHRFDVQGIPCLVLLGSDGKVICKDAASRLRQDPTGAEFPYPKKPVERLGGGHVDLLNRGDKICLYIAADASPESVEKAEDVLMDSALGEFGKDEPDMYFLVADAGDSLTQQILRLLQVEPSPESLPVLAMLELPQFTVADAKPTSSDAVQRFVNGYVAGELKMNQL